MHGLHCLKTWSSTQGIIALSSAEAEYYGIVKAASQGLGLKSLCLDFCRNVSLEILTDASAARSIANRQGLGKVRHIDTHFLWVQQRVNRGDFIVSKVWGKENPADLLTKFLDAESIVKCLNLFGFEYMTGRSVEAPTLSHLLLNASAISSIRNINLHNPNKVRVKHMVTNSVEIEESSNDVGVRRNIGSLARSFFISSLFCATARPQPLTHRCPRQGNLGQGGVLAYNSTGNVHYMLSGRGHLARRMTSL